MNGTSDEECYTWLERHNATTLEDLNNQFTQRHLGGIVFTGLLMLPGILGNLIVLWIYIRRFKQSNYRTYTIWLAIMDITNSCLGMPFLIFYMSRFLIFPSSVFCKFGRFFVLFTTNCGAYILVVIAFDRYRRICKCLQWQLKQSHAKMACGVASCFGIITSFPALILYGIYTVDVGIPNVQGKRCWTDDQYRDKIYPSIYYIGLYIFNFSIAPILVVTYIKIWRFLHKHKGSGGITIGTRKTTITLLAVTMAFLLSAVPHYSMVVVTRIRQDFNCKMSFSEGVLYYTFVFSILLNNSVNPFIYGFLDQRFRRELKTVCANLFLCRIRSPERKSSSNTESEDPNNTQNYM